MGFESGAADCRQFRLALVETVQLIEHLGGPVARHILQRIGVSELNGTLEHKANASSQSSALGLVVGAVEQREDVVARTLELGVDLRQLLVGGLRLVACLDIGREDIRRLVGSILHVALVVTPTHDRGDRQSHHRSAARSRSAPTSA